ncbi:MAG: hypothetical protein FJ317_00715 [SAR202 cluster bacterium]|nr:hypothetical protein [SAR202 cluster bacterium]
MSDLSKAEIQVLGKAVQLHINEPELTEVAYHANALLEAMEAIREPGLEAMEHVPIVVPPLGSLASPGKKKG